MAEKNGNTPQHGGEEEKSNSFTSSHGQLLVGDQKYSLRTLKMVGSTMIFLSASEPECLDEMAVAMKMPNDGKIIGTTILGPHITESQRMAEQLTRRYNRQFFVSFNVNVDRMTGPILEKHLCAYMNKNKELFV
ncbi:uncharacterized protein LOC142237412 [Haematobia irritans]|uniref:uncharacterized protein LOC142237412 n=1 Tax=Haematobia irritans TaxID=7368 RepID=UPI003F4FA6C0